MEDDDIAGDHFARCIEYVLRHSPHVEVQHLLASQQVLQRVTEPVRSSKALKALQSKLLAQRGVSDHKPHISLSPCFVDEQQQVSSHRESTSVNESIQLLESMDLYKNAGMGEEGASPQEKVGKRKRKLLKKEERIRLRKGKTNTIGEFDYLFEIPAVQSQWPHGSNGKELYHWEVSVKFLLYAGPWEVFGLQSPNSAAWKQDPSSPGMAPFEGSIENGGSRTTTADEYNALNSQESSSEVDAFLGCYLGPHVGETLLDRKARLRNQLALSANPCAALMLRDLYQNKDMAESRNRLNKLRNAELQNSPELPTVAEPQTVAELQNVAELRSVAELPTVGKLQNVPELRSVAELPIAAELQNVPELRSVAELQNVPKPRTVAELQTADIAEIGDEDLDSGSREDSEQLSVVASALLKGYLFYEYKLWCYLESHGLRNVTACVPSMQDADQPTEEARLSRNHWMGWWTRDIMEFGDLPRHQHSKWYIVPKLEWLSPVVIPLWEPDRCARVHSLSDFVLISAQVAEEAARLHMPRKRRFLVAEVCWSPDWEPCHESVGEELATRGAWLEVSRGFVVEDTWPESKMYRPHGYVVSWSPSLQGRHPDV